MDQKSDESYPGTMNQHLVQDHKNFELILDETLAEAKRFLSTIDSLPAGTLPPEQLSELNLDDSGIGAQFALEAFKSRYSAWLSGSVGSRYFAFVTGGVTPASLAGDWLASTYDQNAAGSNESSAPQIELETITLLRQLFGLSSDHKGTFVTGATMSNFVGLAIARQWIGNQQGVNFSDEGLFQSAPIKVFSATPHSSTYKALSMLGIGRKSIIKVPCLPEREAINVDELEKLLNAEAGQSCIVVANAGTVNTVDFDDLAAIVKLKEKYHFWLHVDAAFGGFAACSPRYRSLVEGIDFADSITIDAHKWLNVPYDAAMQFTRHQYIQAQVFHNAAVYLGQEITESNFVHLTPENSRRLRALPTWFTLMAYGKEGYAQIVEQTCDLAHWLGEQIRTSSRFELLAPVSLNGICFTFTTQTNYPSLESVQNYLRLLQADGTTFLTPTVYKNIPAIRISITNWRTTQQDIEMTWQALQRVLHQIDE